MSFPQVTTYTVHCSVVAHTTQKGQGIVTLKWFPVINSVTPAPYHHQTLQATVECSLSHTR